MASSKRIRIQSILFALIAGIGILVLKFHAAQISNSSALRSDAMENIVNVLAAAFGLISILFADRPADRDHPYGHGKIEYFSAAFEGGLIFLAGVLIIIDTVHRWVHHEGVTSLGAGLKLNVVAGLMNGAVGGLIYLNGKKHESRTLIADGIHLLTDLASTIALAIGLVLVILTGWTWIDPLLALGVSILLFKTGFHLVGHSASALLDAENPELLEKIVHLLNSKDRGRVITVHELRAQEFGRDKHIDIHLVIPEYLTVKEAHEESERINALLKKEFGKNSQIHTHIDPCERKFCRECSIHDCPIRQAPFQETKPFTVENAVRMGQL